MWTDWPWNTGSHSECELCSPSENGYVGSLSLLTTRSEGDNDSITRVKRPSWHLRENNRYKPFGRRRVGNCTVGQLWPNPNFYFIRNTDKARAQGIKTLQKHLSVVIKKMIDDFITSEVLTSTLRKTMGSGLYKLYPRIVDDSVVSLFCPHCSGYRQTEEFQWRTLCVWVFRLYNEWWRNPLSQCPHVHCLEET